MVSCNLPAEDCADRREPRGVPNVYDQVVVPIEEVSCKLWFLFRDGEKAGFARARNRGPGHDSSGGRWPIRNNLGCY